MGARILVGIDLGTTNSALSYIDTDELPRRLLSYPIPQLVSPGTVAALPTLPSIHHHVGAHELPPAATRLPFTPEDAADPPYVVGELARVQAQAVPGRSVASAKSWLCHPRVDRLKDILPWGGAEDVPRMSPVDVSARFLSHMITAFENDKGLAIADTEVVLTVPASFDEVARELTVEAARRAGIEASTLTLLEEPQAAFYSWLADHSRFAEEVEAGDLIFVCDIGGGTTDFTLISVAKAGGRISFTRTAVGDHLLLGGDNMDLALARRIEQRIIEEGGQALQAHSFQALTQSCRVAKERLLGDDPPDRFGLHIAGRGARLIGGGLRVEISRDDVEEALLDGFFPRVTRDAEPARAHAGLRELGLPYAADAGITRYMAAFLRHYRARPSAVLFNGGVLRSGAIRRRIIEVLASFQDATPRVLTNEVPDLAVARGAAYYALTRRGEGLRISGGAARAYYAEVHAEQAEGPGAAYVCLMPRGIEEGTEVSLSERTFELLTNRPVRFRVFSSSKRQGDSPGDVLTLDAGELTELPPVYTVLRHPRTSQERPLTVTVRARLTEIGTLELWAEERPAPSAGADAAPPLKWRLLFDLRSLGPGAADAPGENSQGLPLPPQAGLIGAAAELIAAVFEGEAAPRGLPRALTQVLGPRDGWPMSTLRGLWEPLKGHRERRARTAEHEARWLNLAGFCLRPGFGYPLDDWRIKEAWRVWNAGLSHERDDACRLEFWILWRRIAGGLSKGQQEEIWKRVAPMVLPSARRADRKPGSLQEAGEIWRALSALERLDVRKKIELGEGLLPQIERRRGDHAVWCLGRIGARQPLYGSIDNVVPREVAERWLRHLLGLPFTPLVTGEELAELSQTMAELARLCGDRVRDLSPETREHLAEFLRNRLPEDEGARLSLVVLEVVARKEREERFAFGDSLPSGLRLA